MLTRSVETIDASTMLSAPGLSSADGGSLHIRTGARTDGSRRRAVEMYGRNIKALWMFGD